MLLLPACGKATGAAALPFDTIPSARLVTPIIREASGIADSRTQPGHIWVEEDSGNPSRLYLLAHTGVVKQTVFLKGITNRDWEDICWAKGRLYLGETGDNNQLRTEYSIYAFEEPLPETDTVSAIDKIRFEYEDGAHDTEAFLVEPESGDIYLFTKRDNPSGIYRIAYPYSLTEINKAVKLGELSIAGVVSAALSADNSKVILKTYTQLFYYTRLADEKLSDLFTREPQLLPYKMEPQGEAVCFAADGSGFFTLSEKGFSSAVYLYFYGTK